MMTVKTMSVERREKAGASTGLDQRRAKYAWECVQNCKSDYVNLAKSAPALVMSNGLMQTLAFYKAKDKAHHRALCEHICGWLHQRYSGKIQGADFASVMGGLYGDSEPRFYREASEEVLALLRWIRQFAAAVNQAKRGDEE